MTHHADDGFGDIEEALAELFEVRSTLEKMTAVPPELLGMREKIEKACHLLDRPWPTT